MQYLNTNVIWLTKTYLFLMHVTPPPGPWEQQLVSHCLSVSVVSGHYPLKPCDLILPGYCIAMLEMD